VVLQEMRETRNYMWMKHLCGVFSPNFGCTCRGICESQIIGTLYVEETDNYFVEVTKDLVLNMGNIKTSYCDGMSSEVWKVCRRALV
jgi:hypothetical protein